MNDSSAQPVSAFENLKWSHVMALLNVLRDYDLREGSHVERRYKDLAQGYQQTLAFVHGIGLVRQDGREIIHARANVETNARDDVLAQLFDVDSPYREEVFQYLRKFQIIDGEVVRRADVIARLRESSCRNFLMDLGIIRHRSSGDDYVVEPTYISLYVASREAKTGFSAARIQLLCDERKAIGDAAELAVLAWEKERLGDCSRGPCETHRAAKRTRRLRRAECNRSGGADRATVYRGEGCIAPLIPVFLERE